MTQIIQIIQILSCRCEMLCRICVQYRYNPGNIVLDHAGYCMAPTRQHELDHTDHTDHTDQIDHDLDNLDPNLLL